MSYSRWSNSVWYTFWCSTPSDYRNDQIFQICDFRANAYFSYKEIKDHEHHLKEYVKDRVIFEMASRPVCIKTPSAISATRVNETDDIISEPPLTYKEAHDVYSDEEYDELIGYIKEFIKDVENDDELLDDYYNDGEKYEKP